MKKIIILLSAALFLFTASCGPKKSASVLIKTSMGDMLIELYSQDAPESVKNFLRYADDGLYNGTIFHRVIPDFMIQGGGFEPGLVQRTAYQPIKNEADNGLKNTYGTIAMARTMQVDSATSQFFINVKDNPALDYRGTGPRTFGYAVFGKVVSGMDVADKISRVSTGKRGPYDDVPAEDVLIISVKRSDAKAGE